MTHSYRVHFFHLVWSTKQRLPYIDAEVESRLYTYIAAIIKNYKGKLIEIGGMSDHVHLLVEMSLLDEYSACVRDVKASSSRWIHKNFPNFKVFEWQEGYGSFTVSYSLLESVRKYIQNQKQHHSKMSFEEEYKKLLKLHDLDYDERFVLG